MRNGQTPTWLKLTLAGLGLLLLIPGYGIFVTSTAKPLHPNPADVPSVARPVSLARDPGAVEKARQLALSHLTENSLPGLSVAVGRNGEIVWAQGFGYADLKTNEPVTPDHKFRIGTASAALTSAAAGLLLEKGALNLDHDVQKYVPGFPRKKWPVTLRQVMAHTSGLASDGGDESELFSKQCKRPAEAVQYFSDESLLFEPGTRYRHSNYGWILVSAAVEAAANQPFLDFMSRQVFNPLGMQRTAPDVPTTDPEGEDFPLVSMVRELFHDQETHRKAAPPTKPVSDQVTAYFPKIAADPRYGLHLMRPLDHSCYSGAGGFASTPSDLVRFAIALNNGSFLKPSTVDLLQTSQRLASGEETGHGLGWYDRTVTLAGKQTRLVGQDGKVLGGVAASLVILPELGIVVAATSNISYADTPSLVIKIAEAFAQQTSTSNSR